MKKLVALLCLAFAQAVFAQPLVRSFPFSMLSRDTSIMPDLPQTGGEVAGSHGRVGISNEGHFVTADGKRIRFFGTELNYGANFLSSTDARDLARRFKKLGINAVRINYTDHSAYPGASLILYDPSNSYHVDTPAFHKLDTLITELSQAGIYTFFTLQTVHYHWQSDGVAWWPDSLEYPNYLLHHYLDDRAAMLQRQWARTVLEHVNHITGIRYGDDPAIAAVEINGTGTNGSYNFGLTAAWRYDWLSYKGPGTSTLTFHRSRKLDTLYSEYLLRKYSNDAGINAAWRGAAIQNPPNLLENGSFEDIGSSAWSFAVQGGATGIQTLLSPGKDSDFCMMAALGSLGPNKQPSDAYLLNLSTRCGKDTLYELHFWAKVRYSAQRPVLVRQIYPIVVSYSTGSTALSQVVDIDTTWKEFTIPFRATASGLQYIGFYFGQQLGDVLFDGITVKLREELGLILGESAINRTIIRTPYSRVAQLPYKRVRDMSLFYDSLQRTFYQKMIRSIRDTIKSQVLINAFPSWYWSSALEPYANTMSDFTQSYINTDYMQQRPDIPYSDSTWRISNNTPLRDAGSYALGLVASQSIEGKPMIVNWLNPTMNQHYASMLPFVTAYASLQDWDGIFFTQYATYRDGLFTDQMFPAVSGYSTFYDIAGNPSIVGQFPAMSELFRTVRFQPAETYVPIVHTKDEMELLPTITDYRHPFNVEGYLDPNIITNFKVRQRYNAPVRKIAAEYPFVSDTSAKLSDTKELYWSQSSGHFVAVGRTAASVGGIFGEDTLRLGAFSMRRIDQLRDPIAVTLLSMDTMPLGTSALTYMTIAGRGQNTGMVWVDSFGFGKHWGTAPTLMSAPILEFYLRSDRDFVYFHALDELGKPKGHHSAIMIDSAARLFKYTLDPREWKSMWYTIEQTNLPSGVRQESDNADKFDVTVYPNPSSSFCKAVIELGHSANVRMSLIDQLGREVILLARERLNGGGKYSYDFDVTSLPAGRYLLVADLGSRRIVRSLSVVK